MNLGNTPILLFLGLVVATSGCVSDISGDDEDEVTLEKGDVYVDWVQWSEIDSSYEEGRINLEVDTSISWGHEDIELRIGTDEVGGPSEEILVTPGGTGERLDNLPVNTDANLELEYYFVDEPGERVSETHELPEKPNDVIGAFGIVGTEQEKSRVDSPSGGLELVDGRFTFSTGLGLKNNENIEMPVKIPAFDQEELANQEIQIGNLEEENRDYSVTIRNEDEQGNVITETETVYLDPGESKRIPIEIRFHEVVRPWDEEGDSFPERKEVEFGLPIYHGEINYVKGYSTLINSNAN